MSTPFTLGVNYWPRTKAMNFWRSFDLGEVRDDFALMADLGMNTVRIFLLWEDWQPTPDIVSMDCLRYFEQVCNTAEDNGLKLDVTFFTGHMSGPNWSPRWLLDASAPLPSPEVHQVVASGQAIASSYRNMFTDYVALQAEQLLLETVVGRFHNHAGIGIWNLGNEPDLFAYPPNYDMGTTWVSLMRSVILEQDETHPITIGLHAPSLNSDNGFRVDDVFRATDIATMHAYPMYSPLSRHPLDPDYVPFTCALTSALCGKPTLMEEWGGCTAPQGEASQTWSWTAFGKPRQQFMASEDAMAHYVGEVLPRLVEVGATGALLWCFADYHESLWDKPPCNEARHERHFGLVRPDGSLKPHAEVVRRFAATQPHVQTEATRRVVLDVDADTYYQDPATHMQNAYTRWVADA